MEKLSASGIAGLFENFPNKPRKKTKPGEFLLNTVFPRGHVREHDSIHYLNRCEGIQSMLGQNGYARDREYLEENLQKVYETGEWLIKKDSRVSFKKYFLKALGIKISDNRNFNIAYKEEGFLMLLEEQVGEHFLDEVADIIKDADVMSVESFQEVIPSILAKADECFFGDLKVSKEYDIDFPTYIDPKGYYVDSIPYTLPRYRADYDVEVICQPDGFCLARNANGDLVPTVVEIKSPMFAHYTSNEVRKDLDNGEVRIQSAADRRKNWTKYLVQIAVEMDVTGAEQAILLSWFEFSGKVIVLDRELMQPLIDVVKIFARSLGEKAQGEKAENLEEAFHNVVGSPPPKYKSPRSLSIAAIKKELKETFGLEDAELKLGRLKAPYVELLKSKREASAAPVVHSTFDDVVTALNSIMDTLTSEGSDALQPVENFFMPSAEDQLKTEAVQKAKKEAEAARLAAAQEGESKDNGAVETNDGAEEEEYSASFHTYVIHF